MKTEQVVQDRVLTLVEMSRGAPRTRVSAATDAEIEQNLRKVLESARKKSKSHAAAYHSA